MNKRIWLLFLGLVALATLIGVVESMHAGHISQQALLKTMANSSPSARLQLLDVRSQHEYQVGHIPGAIHIPFWSIGVDTNARFQPEQPIIIYCELGPRAGFAGLWLRMKGYQNIVYLEGHMAAWRQAGLPLQMPQVVSTARK